MQSLFHQLDRKRGKFVSLKKTLLSFFKKSSGLRILCLSFITIITEIAVYERHFGEKVSLPAVFPPILFNRYNLTPFYNFCGIGAMGRFFKIE